MGAVILALSFARAASYLWDWDTAYHIAILISLAVAIFWYILVKKMSPAGIEDGFCFSEETMRSEQPFESAARTNRLRHWYRKITIPLLLLTSCAVLVLGVPAGMEHGTLPVTVLAGGATCFVVLWYCLGQLLGVVPSPYGPEVHPAKVRERRTQGISTVLAALGLATFLFLVQHLWVWAGASGCGAVLAAYWLWSVGRGKSL